MANAMRDHGDPSNARQFGSRRENGRCASRDVRVVGEIKDLNVANGEPRAGSAVPIASGRPE